MANHSVFPAFLNRQNRQGAPATALIVTGVLASVMILMNYSRNLAQGFTFLSVMVTAANMPLYLAVAVGLFKLWKQKRLTDKLNQSYYLALSALFATAYCLWAFVGVGAESMLWVCVLGSVSLPIFLGMRYWQKT
jgi:APA family basic amino acid/polyamine antiporter